MEIRVLGAHNVESASTRLTSLLIDGVLAVDAGAITSSLTLPEQEKLGSILLTHCHFDHVRDVAAIALNVSHFGKTVQVYSQASTLQAVSEHILNGVIYPDFAAIRTPDTPPIRYCPLEPHKTVEITGYRVLALPVTHVVPTVAYQVTSRDNKSVFFSGDAGPGVSTCWEHVSPDFLFMDVTMPDRMEEHALSSGHLTPRLLGEELAQFQKARGYLPPVAAIHIGPVFEEEIRKELDRVSGELGASISASYEGMTVML